MRITFKGRTAAWEYKVQRIEVDPHGAGLRPNRRSGSKDPVFAVIDGEGKHVFPSLFGFETDAAEWALRLNIDPNDDPRAV